MSFRSEIRLSEVFISPRCGGTANRGVYVFFQGDETHLGKLRYSPGTTNEDKIAHAFLEKGPAVFADLEHDFLLFLVIPSRGQLYLVRDRFGMQPLYFKTSGPFFSFSQKIADLRGTEAISVARVRNYLANFSDSEPVPDSGTFFKGIHSVPPGCYFRKEGSNPGECVAYWKPEPESIAGREPAELFGEFRDRIVSSVAYSVRNSERVSAHLSGGLDSSVISLVYSEISSKPFPTFYFDTSDKNHRDAWYAREVSARIRSRHIHVHPRRENLYASLWRLSKATCNPEAFILPSDIHYAIAEESFNQGCTAILTGMDGDSVVGHGWGHLDRLKKNNDWEVFIDQVARFRVLSSDGTGKGTAGIRREIIAQELFTLLKTGEIQRLRQLMHISRKKFGYVPLGFIAWLARKTGERLQGYHAPQQKEYFLNRNLRPESHEVFLPAGLYEHSDQEVIDNFRAAVNGEYPLHFEQFHAIGQACGQKFLHPFFDRRLFELCLALPDALRYGGGRTRWIMRNAMKDLLPPALYNRRDKDEFTLYLVSSCADLWRYNRERLEENRELWHYIDKGLFLKQMDILLSGKQPLNVSRGLARKLNRIMYLGVWLDALRT